MTKLEEIKQNTITGTDGQEDHDTSTNQTWFGFEEDKRITHSTCKKRDEKRS